MTYIESSGVAGDPGHGPAHGEAPHPQSALKDPLAWTALGDMLATDIDSDAQARLARTAAGRMHPPRFFVYLQLEGEGIVRQDGREALLRTGDFTLCDGARHYEISCPAGSRMLMLGVAAAKLRRHIACPESLAANAMRGAAGVCGLLSGFLRHYWLQCRYSLDGESAEQVAVAVLDVLGAAYAHVPRTHAERSSRGTAHRIRIINYIHAHLYDPELSPAQIAQACRITTRYLHYLFSDGEETVARYILVRRLEASSQALLADSLRGRTVTAIAFDHGFNSATHFGRVFRAHFGMTPREYRARAACERRPGRRDPASVPAAAAGC
jgi:AraC-like DNA-binding protein/mannose-6-phosphate isomerase-like protein (cupin superfamily)